MKQLEAKVTIGKAEKAVEVDRNFYELRDRNDGESRSNLTELCASTSVVDNGYMRHSDWMGHIVRFHYALKHLERLKSNFATVADVGCGELQWMHYLWRNRCKWPEGFNYWGLDLRANPNWFDKVRPKANMNLVCADLVLDNMAEIPRWPGRFDLVVSFECFEHVPVSTQPEFMERLFEWTKPGAVCLFSTPNGGVSDTVADNHKDPLTGEVREMSYGDKVRLAESVGFRMEKSFGAFAGFTRLPEHFQRQVLEDRTIKAMKEFLDLNLFNAVVAAGYPEESNNALMVLRRP